MFFNTSLRWRHLFLLAVCVFIMTSSVSGRGSQKRRRSLSRRPIRQTSGFINIQFVRATTVEIGFTYVQGAKRFVASAKEWIDGKYVQSVPLDKRTLSDQARSTTLRNLIPGREYLLQVQALDGFDRPIGGSSSRIVRTSQRCYICNGKKNNDACKGTRNSMECPHDKDACLNEVRYSKGVPMMMKRCAQWRPELGKQIQNGLDITTACTGRENIKDAACKCMCRSDLCNEAEMPCINECFNELPTPEGSVLKCKHKEKINKIGTICRWSCLPGYDLRGLNESRCRNDRTWSVLSPPECIPRDFDPKKDRVKECPMLVPKEEDHLRMVCSSGNKPNSMCSFNCEDQFYLKGDSFRICDEKTGKWSGIQPYCVEITCPKIIGSGGLLSECTNGEKIGSICSFSCPEGRQFEGKTSLTCLPGGRWSSTMPKCIAPDCGVEPLSFPNVLKECGRIPNRKKGRVCHFSCQEGYERFGAGSSYCYSGNSWTASSPTCKRIVCRPDMYAPVNGFVRCNDRSFYGSTCAFSCKDGYMLLGKDTTTCKNTKQWTNMDVPICKKITCPRFPTIKNGLYVCNGGQDFNSVCRFTCKRGFGFAEETQTKLKCVAKTMEEMTVSKVTTGKWDGSIPKCRPVGCPPLGEPPLHATVKCVGATPLGAGTVCTYRCASGFRIEGSTRTTCVARSDGSAIGDWSSEPPTCERVECADLPELHFGRVQCTNGNFAGSECFLECDHGHYLTGKSLLTCSVLGSWSSKMAKCRVVTCSSHPLLKNGRFDCHDESTFRVDYECEASCNKGYKLSQQGNAVCGASGKWLISDDLFCEDRNECTELDEFGNLRNGGCEQECVNTVGSFKCLCRPNYELQPDRKTCRILICPLLENIPKGRIACLNSNRIGSTCTLRCVPGYEASESVKTNCLTTGKWDKKIGTCSRISCRTLATPQHGNMDCTLGYKFGSMCSFVCDTGFEMLGKSTTQCEADEKWTNAVPTCRRITCDVTFLIVRNGLVTCSDDNKFDSSCATSCNDGYRLKGQPQKFGSIKMTSQCQADGTWDVGKPDCVKKRCEPNIEEIIETRHNGTVKCTDGDLFGSSCKLTCDQGFSVDGNYRTTCSGDAEWSKVLGTCQKVRCPALVAPANSQLFCSDKNLYLSRCAHYCVEGYELIGTSQTECSSDRTWTKKSPKCKRIECPLSFMKLLKGSVTCSEEQYFGSVCEYKCDPGYEFMDTTTDIRKSFGAELDEDMTFNIIRVSCDSSGLWDTEKPVCIKHQCTPPSKVLQEARPNSSLTCTDGDKYESVCELSCDQGFEVMNGRASIQCGTDRSWSPALGVCERVRCPMFEPLINGAVQCSNSNRYESRCLFGCFRGYRLIGSPVSFCKHTRVFSHEAPTCEKIECPTTHTKLKNGDATCTDGVKFGSECVYVCNPGYEMVFKDISIKDVDNAVLKCKADGTWGGKLPLCKRKECSIHDGAIAKAKLHGDVVCSESYWFGSVCNLDCKVGFQLVGAASTHCNSDADWEPALGYCLRRECPGMKIPTNGSMECTNGNKFESICKFKCDYGFELFGIDESECLAMEYFSSAAPTCNEILCPSQYLTLLDGQVTCSNMNKLASRCQYKCDAGYQLTSQSADITECKESYAWDEDMPECEKKVCPQGDSNLVRAAEHGSLTCTDSNKYESVCSVACYPGYELRGGDGRTECGADQEWVSDIGYCSKIICEEFAPIDHGSIQCTDFFRYQSVCSFSCDAGYELTHTMTSTCLADRTFDTKTPDCIRITCSTFHLRIHNGKVDCTDGNSFESVCKYECNLGFERIHGSPIAQCLADRTWDADKTGCERVQCDKSDDMLMKAEENGKVRCTSGNFFESICSVNCDEGFKLSRFALGRTRCNEFAKWDGELGHCERIVCALYTAPSNGEIECTDENKFESSCVFTCDKGYKMVGSSRADCQSDQTWTKKMPTCKKIECSESNLFLDNGISNCTDSNKYLSVCSFKCYAGYEMETEIKNAVCTASRAWTTNKPNCVKKECDINDERIIEASINGAVTCTDGARYQTICSLKCDEGYELRRGDGKIECLATAKWDKDIGRCEKIVCTQIDIPANSKMACTDTNRYESVCTFVCEEGYEKVGADEMVCLSNGSFSNQPPTCVKSKCSPDYLTLPFGEVLCTDLNLFESICNYECSRGFRIAGNSPNIVRSQCLSNQTWSVEIPICEKKTCPYDTPDRLKALEHGSIECTEGNRFGSVCSVKCNTGYELIGSEKTECEDTADWRNPIGHCTKIKCEFIRTPDFATVSCTDARNFNSSCSYSCEQGHRFADEDHVIDEEITLTCSSMRMWTTPGAPPECIKKNCTRDILKLMNGNVDCTNGALYRSQCLFKCDPGYELVEPGDDFDVTTIILTCGPNSTWDQSTQPKCKRITCEPNMHQLDEESIHSKITCTRGSEFESKCDINCNHGYELVEGVKQTECQNDRTWAPMLGNCQKISCPVITAHNESSLQCSDGFRFKSHCRVICRPGFEIYDPEGDYDPEAGLECKADGQWCGDVPTCSRIKCPNESLSLVGGMAKCTDGNVFESECRYTCNLGYQMTQGQEDDTVCTSHMTWSNPSPTCEKRRCPANETSIREAKVNGEVICSEENKFDSRCELECSAGYELSGEPQTTCLHTGEWSNGIGLCNKIQCNVITAPSNAVMKCRDGSRYESLCTFACKIGYMLTEASVKAGNGVVCQADRSWDGEFIECEKITCPSEGYTSLDNGEVQCNDSNHYTSRCLFECKGGHELEMKIDPDDEQSATVNCTELGFWDVPRPPKCVPVQCSPSAEELAERFSNGKIECPGGSKFKSECSLSCNQGYELIGGESITICGSDKRWGPELSGCQKISCDELEIPSHGRMVCDDGFHYMSQCVFECLPGFEMVSHGKKMDGITTCESDGTWEGVVPRSCKQVECDISYLKLEDGKVLCSDMNKYESECQYVCQTGFELKNSDSKLASCLQDGTWDVERPACRVKTCKSEYAANGRLYCSGTEYNAVCRLSCDIGHVLVNGAKSSTCTDVTNGGKQAIWSPPLGDCEKVQCPLLPEIPHGMIQCSDGIKYRSVCYVHCQPGYKVMGAYFSARCLSRATWSRVFGICERVTCDASYLDVDYGSVRATDGNNEGSTLTFKCPTQGFKYTGESQVTCQINGRWDSPRPRCERFTCAPINLPNGFVECSGKKYNDFGSKCTYHCHDNYELQGSTATKCNNGKWTAPLPYCKGHCDINFKSIPFAGVECTNSHYHHSKCRFWCDSPSQAGVDARYSLYGNNLLTCKADGFWDGVPPCCAQNCPPWGKMDIFFVFDSSSSVGYRNWKRLLEFANEVLGKFHIGPDNVLAGALRYNRDVDTTMEIPIGKFQNKQDLQRAIKYMPYGGWGTSTGKALRHIVDHSMKQPGNRPDVTDIVILFTDGVSQDNVTEPAATLQSTNATVHVIGIEGQAGTLDLEQMTTIASHPLRKHVSIIRGGFERLTKELSNKMGQQVCNNPCLLDKQYRTTSGSYVQRHEDDSHIPIKKSDFIIM